MEKIILDNLKAIEAKEGVKILLAIESGSRAWGFASPDSDYDVRFIYVRKTQDYLKLQGQRDVIEWVLDDVLDINGWDLDKALRLLHKSNPTLLEWLRSPIVYHISPEIEGLGELAKQYFEPKKAVFHYLKMAENNYKNYLLDEQVRAKKYFYALRPILAALWILNRQTIPPIEFDQLVEAELVEDLKPVVADLLAIKQNLSESGLIDCVSALNIYIETELARLRELAEGLDVSSKDWADLNTYFYDVLGVTD